MVWLFGFLKQPLPLLQKPSPDDSANRNGAAAAVAGARRQSQQEAPLDDPPIDILPPAVPQTPTPQGGVVPLALNPKDPRQEACAEEAAAVERCLVLADYDFTACSRHIEALKSCCKKGNNNRISIHCGFPNHSSDANGGSSPSGDPPTGGSSGSKQQTTRSAPGSSGSGGIPSDTESAKVGSASGGDRSGSSSRAKAADDSAAAPWPSASHSGSGDSGGGRLQAGWSSSVQEGWSAQEGRSGGGSGVDVYFPFWRSSRPVNGEGAPATSAAASANQLNGPEAAAADGRGSSLDLSDGSGGGDALSGKRAAAVGRNAACEPASDAGNLEAAGDQGDGGAQGMEHLFGSRVGSSGGGTVPFWHDRPRHPGVGW